MDHLAGVVDRQEPPVVQNIWIGSCSQEKLGHVDEAADSGLVEDGVLVLKFYGS